MIYTVNVDLLNSHRKYLIEKITLDNVYDKSHELLEEYFQSGGTYEKMWYWVNFFDERGFLFESETGNVITTDLSQDVDALDNIKRKK